MILELKMPALSPTMKEGTLAKWLISDGDSVRSGDILAEIETDKATVELEAVVNGTIDKILVSEGTDGVKVGAVLALIQHETSDTAVLPTSSVDTEREEKGSIGAPATQSQHAPAATDPPSPRTILQDDGDRPIRATALARRLAHERGVDLASLTGSGSKGRILKCDLPGVYQVTATRAAKAEDLWKVPSRATVTETTVPHEKVELTKIQKATVEQWIESKQTIPHIYITVDIRIDNLLTLRDKLNIELERTGTILSVNDLLIKALGIALLEVPSCNVQFVDNSIIRFSRADICVPVPTQRGQLTQVVVDAGSKRLSLIAAEIKQLITRARDEMFKFDACQTGTATLTNMGGHGVKQLNAALSPPQAMIMAIGASEQRAWVVDGTHESATVLSATGSFDHRAINGADGAALMRTFKALLENPMMLIAA